MTITSLSGVGGLPQSQSIVNASSKLQVALSNLLGTSSDATDVSTASQLQSQTSALKQVSTNLAQASSLTEVANGGLEQIQGALSQLQSIAQQAASPIANPANISELNQEFTQTLSTIDQIASGTTFNGKSLLNGKLSGNNALSLDSILNGGNSDGDTLSVGDLSSAFLLPNVTKVTPDNASEVLASINSALGQVGSTIASTASFQQTLNFASASVDSAVVNQQAATATLSDSDIASASTQSTQDQVQYNAAISLAAQGNNLSSALLQLVG